jgi:hypothetical protein
VVIVASKGIHWCDQQSYSVGVTNDLWTSFPCRRADATRPRQLVGRAQPPEQQLDVE